MNQGARNKLRNMGGIMASSPKLMQAAFQDGGPVMPMPPSMQFNDAARSRIGPPVAGLGRIAPMMPQPITPGTAPGLPTESAAERLMAQSVLSRQGILPLPGEGPLGDVIKKQQEVAVADEVARGERVQRRQESRVKELRDRFAEANTPEEKAAISNQINELDAARQEGVTRGQPLTMDEATLPSTETADSRQEYFEQGGPRGLEALATPIQTSVQDPEKAEKMQQALKKALEEQDTSTGDGGGDDGGGDGGPPPAPSKKDLRSRYKEKLDLFKEIYGEDDEDRARDKAMSLAMLGLAIASGQSPDFLTNVAQGTMAGLQGMSEQEQARRERERGLRTLALETAIGEQTAGAEAEAEAARMDQEQQNQLELEREKARLDAMYGAGSREARNIIDFTQNAYDSAFKAASEQTAPDYDAKIETPHQYAMRQAQQASSSMQKMFPGYGGAGVTGGAPSEQQVQATIQAAKAAIAKGQDETAVRRRLESVGIDPSALDQ